MTRIARILLGLVFVVFSANYFVPFLPQPSSMPAGALGFVVAFAGSGMLTFVKVIEMVAGLALLANVFTPLALALLAPIIVGIVLFHGLLAPSGLPIGLVALALEVFLAWSYRGAFAPMPQLKTEPAAKAVAVSAAGELEAA
jgi:hypothetical protein